jgi:hypothetical protein
MLQLNYINNVQIIFMDQQANMGGGKMYDGGKTCSCKCHSMSSYFFIVIGILWLLTMWVPIIASLNMWLLPILFIVLGIVRMKSGSCKCC